MCPWVLGGPTRSSSRHCVDPDPLTIALTVLSALGSAAGLVDIGIRLTRGQSGLKDRQIQRIQAALDSAERAAIDVRSKLEILATFVRNTGADIIERHLEGQPRIGFGSTRLVLSKSELAEWQRLQDDVIRCARQLQHSELEVLKVHATVTTPLSQDGADEAYAIVDILNEAIAGMMNQRDFLIWLDTLHEACNAVISQVRQAGP